MIAVVKSGLLTTVQDLGRSGYAHLGVARSGALDEPALIRANRLVGNADGAAGLETTLTGVSLRPEIPVTVAVTGAVAPVSVDGQRIEFDTAVAVPAGALFEVGPATFGVRSYVAIGGGVTVAPVLGSRSTDTLCGLGPPPLRAGHVFPIGSPAPAVQPALDLAYAFSAALATLAAEPTVVELRTRPGPRQDWFSTTARDAFFAEEFTLTVKSNRVGARLAGPVLSRAIATELPSEGIVLGAVQVPSDGQPLVFLADHPTTGGYPIIAVVERADLPRLAQARPGAVVRFVPWI